MEATALYLPDECWECVLRFVNGDHRCMESLSLVSKQFLSITNRLRFSLTICDLTLPFLPRLFHRFPTLTSLDLTRFHVSDLDALLLQLTPFSFHLRSLNISDHSTFPVNGLQALREKMKTLTSLTSSNMGHLSDTDIFLIGICFPLLEELDLSFPKFAAYTDNGIKFLSLKLPKLRKVNLSGNDSLEDLSLFYLCKNCELLEEVVIFRCPSITDAGIASAIRQRPSLRSFSVTNFVGGTSPLPKCQFVRHLDLRKTKFLDDRRVAELSRLLGDMVSINVSGCKKLTESALFALLSNCPRLTEIRMVKTRIGIRHVRDSKFLMDVVINPHHQVKSLYLAHNSWLNDKSIEMFASICPNLQFLDLSFCYGISEGVGEILRRCGKIRDLSLVSCLGVKLLGMNFQVPKLEVLNLSHSTIDDEALYVISKSCCGLIQLNLEQCYDVTEKGVTLVVENCTQLREINLGYCHNVSASVVEWMVLSRPSLRKITAPPSFYSHQKELLLRHGCLVCSLKYEIFRYGNSPSYDSYIIFK